MIKRTSVKGRSYTKKKELAVLEKFINSMHGNSWPISKKVMLTILGIDEFDDLCDLKKRYKRILRDE